MITISDNITSLIDQFQFCIKKRVIDIEIYMENGEIGETSRESKGKAPLLGNSRGGSYKRAIGIFDVILRISAAAITMGTT